LVQVKNKTSQEVLRTYSDNAVIHLKYGGVESTARKSNEAKYEVTQQEVGSATVVPARSTLVEKESLYSLYVGVAEPKSVCILVIFMNK
jgi:hypothetical protein